MMKTTLAALTVLCVLFGLVLVSDALAQPDPTEASETASEDSGAKSGEVSTGEQITGLTDAIKGGKWVLAIGFLSMMLGGIGRWLMSMKWDFWKGKAGGFTIAGIMGLATLGSGIVAMGGFSLDLLMAAAAAAVTAMGAHGPMKVAKENLAG